MAETSCYKSDVFTPADRALRAISNILREEAASELTVPLYAKIKTHYDIVRNTGTRPNRIELGNLEQEADKRGQKGIAEAIRISRKKWNRTRTVPAP